MEAVSNTSPLIFLVRLPALLPVVARLFDRVWVPQLVVREAVEAALVSSRDDVRLSGSQVQDLLRHAIFKVAEAPTPLAGLPQGLGEGESATLTLALAKHLQWVLLDDRAASSIARRLGLEPLPVSALPLVAAQQGWMGVDEALDLLAALVASRYRLAPHLQQELTARLERLR